VRYELTGAPHEWVNGKDVFLHVAAEYGAATSQCAEFGGPGLGQLPMTFLREIVAVGGIIPQLEASGRLRPATEH